MKITTLIFFLIVNFGALYIGGLLMANGPQTDWYMDLNKAPWTPAGWVFGAAWTTIMLCFSIYMAHLFRSSNKLKLATLFAVQFVLNVSWNYVFFNRHFILWGLVIIILLTILIFYMTILYWKRLRLRTLLIIPYGVWLLVATSLNLYIVINN
jgi:tryptophan-rich sensory protein